MSHKTANEVKSDLISKLGPDFGHKIHYIGNALSNLYVEWKIFRYLFVQNKNRVNQLNAASGITSYAFSKVLHEGLVLGLCRLTDSAKTGGGKNLSLSSLSEHLNDHFEPNMISEYEE